ncbi:hypothetical protein [Heyndrickxia oleronia]|jgi:hypothetical protein|uniref:hypothetical protein n=1 Tax=Heyndrickxia oleronia TaxID=38875 RepID=UPI00242AC2CF|nr:hypothetical protein [Heyndrickxia oleronia]MCI1763637.1 hypothetical protein [Heyndrickxia oleronia]
MATPNRWAIRDAGIATFYSLKTKKPVVTLKTLKTSGLENTGETVYARGGFGNPKLVGFSGNREAKLTLSDAIFDNKALAMLTGNDLIEGARNISRYEELDVVSGKVTLSSTPVGDLVGVFVINEDGTLGQEIDSTEYDVTGKEVEFTSGVIDGEKVSIYYSTSTDSTAKTLRVTSDKFGQTFRVVLQCLVRDEYTQQDFAAQIEIPVAKFEDNFSVALAVDGDPAVLDLNLEILKSPTSTDMWLMTIYDEDELV